MPLPGWRSRIQVAVEVGRRGTSVGDLVWDVGRWDVGHWAGVEPTFEALSGAEVTAFASRRGREKATQRMPAGTCQVALAWSSPTGRWSFKPDAPVTIGMEMRLSARVDGGAPIPIFRGAVRNVRDHFDADGPFELFVSLIERKSELAAVDLPERPVEGLGDTLAARLSRIDAFAGVDLFYERFETGGAELQSSNFARNLLDEAEVANDSVGGEFYVDREGFLVARRRLWYRRDLARVPQLPRSWNAQIEWSNDAARPLLVSPAGTFETEQDVDDVVNQVSFAEAGGVAYTAGGPTTDSAKRYGLRTHQRFDLVARYHADVVTLADEYLAQQIARTERVDAPKAVVNPFAPAAAIARVIDVELLDRHDVYWNDGSGDDYTVGFNVQGVAHDVRADGTWTVGVNLWRYIGSPGPGTAVWGTGVWGTAKWG